MKQYTNTNIQTNFCYLMFPILFSPNTSKFDSSQAPRLPTTNTECCTCSTDFDVSFCRISMFSCCIPHPNPICDALGSLIQSPPPPPLYTTEWVLRHSRPKFSLPNGTINYFHPLSKSNIPLKALLLSLTVLRAQLWIVWFGDLGQKGALTYGYRRGAVWWCTNERKYLQH